MPCSFRPYGQRVRCVYRFTELHPLLAHSALTTVMRVLGAADGIGVVKMWLGENMSSKRP